MSLEARMKTAQAGAFFVKPVAFDEDGNPTQWTTPGKSRATAMEYHTITRKDGHFQCWKQTPLNSSGVACMGNRVAAAGVCVHVMMVAIAEMRKQKRTVRFWRTLEEAERQHRPHFRLRGEAGCVYVTHRKE